MVKLGDLLDVIGDVTKLEVLAYNEYKLQHRWIFGENISETIHQWHDRKNGLLSIIDRKINVHGDVKRNGTGEMGWGPNKSCIPQAMLDAEVWHMLLSSRTGRNDGQELTVQVHMSLMVAQLLKSELAKIERPIVEDEE